MRSDERAMWGAGMIARMLARPIHEDALQTLLLGPCRHFSRARVPFGSIHRIDPIPLRETGAYLLDDL